MAFVELASENEPAKISTQRTANSIIVTVKKVGVYTVAMNTATKTFSV